MSAMAASIFLPSIPQLAADIKTTETIVNVTVAIFIVVVAIAPIIWSPLSGFYGRKPIYLASIPIAIAGSIGVALSRNVGDIIGTRILQGTGSSAVLAVGAGTIGDIFR
jgi:MFS family permease